VNNQAWCQRLERQLPGWKVWRWGVGGKPGTAGWYAAPAPSDTPHSDVLLLPYRLGPYATPQELREEARKRYGDGDTCDTCNDDWRLCGHRQDETRDHDWVSLR
jgi:hypothetical protein